VAPSKDEKARIRERAGHLREDRDVEGELVAVGGPRPADENHSRVANKRRGLLRGRIRGRAGGRRCRLKRLRDRAGEREAVRRDPYLLVAGTRRGFASRGHRRDIFACHLERLRGDGHPQQPSRLIGPQVCLRRHARVHEQQLVVPGGDGSPRRLDPFVVDVFHLDRDFRQRKNVGPQRAARLHVLQSRGEGFVQPEEGIEQDDRVRRDLVALLRRLRAALDGLCRGGAVGKDRVQRRVLAVHERVVQGIDRPPLRVVPDLAAVRDDVDGRAQAAASGDDNAIRRAHDDHLFGADLGAPDEDLEVGRAAGGGGLGEGARRPGGEEQRQDATMNGAHGREDTTR
jgi:hypothetical protein